MNLVGYLRVSSIGQATDGFGLELQRTAITAWAEHEGHDVTHWCEDAAVAGTVEAADRPGFACALALIAETAVVGIVAYDMTRFARDLLVQEVALSIVWEYGGLVFTTATGLVPADDTSEPYRTMVRQIMGAIAQFDRAQTVARLARGKREAALRGQRVDGRWPYGEHPQRTFERPVLQRILDLYDQGLTPSNIATRLNREAAPTRLQSSKWHCNTVKGILRHAGKLGDTT